MRSLRLALQLLRRDLASGELRLLGLALVVAVTASTAVAFFTDRVERALGEQAASLIAADLAIEHGEPLPTSLVEAAEQRGLVAERWRSFPSVIFNGERPVLVQVKSVGQRYPLRGRLRVQTADGTAGSMQGPPPRGQVWVEQRLLGLLGRQLGERIALGGQNLQLTGLLLEEPDRGGNLFQFAPRVFMHPDDLDASDLLGPASRVKHRLLLSGERKTVAGFRNWAKNRLPLGAELFDLNNARPELRAALERGSDFLTLAALTASLLAGAALAISSRGYIQRQSDAAALMRSFGGSTGQVLRIFLWRVLLLGLAASLIGSLLGLAGQQLLTELVGAWFVHGLPPPGPRPLLLGLGLGVLLMLGFALPPLVALSRIPPLRVLRRDLSIRPATPLAWLSAALVLALLVFWQAGDAKVAGRLLGGLAGGMLLFYGAARLLLLLLGRLQYRLSGNWRAGAAALARHRAMTTLQLAAFGLALTVLLVLAVVRADLLDTWQDSLPPDTPDHFLINIQPHEVAPLEKLLASHGLGHAGLHPMIRGRLTAINDKPVVPDSFTTPRARRLAAREFNMSQAAQPRADNRVLAGRWWQGDEAGLSVEEGLAQTLGIGLGDRLSFFIAGETVTAPVTSLRSVRWDSFQVNFFVIGSPALMAQMPTTYISSFHLGDRAGLLQALAEHFPGVSVLDVGALLDQVRQVISRGAQAVEAVFAFTLLAALVLMLAAMQTQRTQRARETGLLRTLGATRSQLLAATAVEFFVLGLLAGLLGASMAGLIGWVLASQVFELSWLPDWRLWSIGLLAGAMLVGLTGMGVTRKLLDGRPAELLNQRLE